MKVSRVGLWSIWLYGVVFILLSVYFIQSLPFRDEILFDSGDVANPKITIFSAPTPYSGSAGKRQTLAIRSWLASSPHLTVVLFTQDPLAASFASASGSRVLIDSSVDFTFLGTPFFHSMVERSRAFETDISVFVNSETVLLSGFISTLYHAYKLDNDWLLVASLRNVSYFPFHFDDSGRHWLREDGNPIKLQEMMLEQNWEWSDCDDRMLMAWNSRNAALFNGVIPPFLFGKGIHNHWIINEVVSSEFRFVFDASWTISCLYLNDHGDQSNHSEDISSFSNIGSWENVGNAHLGASYGSLLFKEIDYSSLLKLVNCDGKYLFVDTKEDTTYPFRDQKLSVWSRRILHSKTKKKNVACVNNIKTKERMSNCSFGNQLKYLVPLDSPFSLESLLLATADENQTIVLAVAGYSYKDMLMSWVCRLRRLHVRNFLICALDKETYEFSVLQGLPVFYDPSAPSNISFNDCHFGTTCFQRVTKVKSRMVLKILKLGYNVLFSDVDVYWFSNPLPTLSSFGPAILLAQSDEYRAGPVNLPRRLNSGFYFARSDVSTIAAMEKVVKHAANSSLSEQPSFYDTLCGVGGSYRIGDDRCVEPETNLTVQFLDRNLFPNGAYLELWQKKNVKEACAKHGCLILHNNWISGRMKKLERQVSSGLWEYDNGKRMCCKDT
ncbi:beta-arabinofuranosyltransferase RAY1 isoform X2 [Euphorbia lathyris]|uniref:beta-arabinofuranosyltransferase RAY1 isoform X2 n=1 Tax=Euphorbia lathyris TaxID=212925 RepID=UPI003314146C